MENIKIFLGPVKYPLAVIFVFYLLLVLASLSHASVQSVIPVDCSVVGDKGLIQYSFLANRSLVDGEERFMAVTDLETRELILSDSFTASVFLSSTCQSGGISPLYLDFVYDGTLTASADWVADPDKTKYFVSAMLGAFLGLAFAMAFGSNI